ncbi:MAG: 50S ribosomal protein L6 [Candidatus Sungbacteria bacterium RIFCSPLOWO2_01_FULL_60_25]|uniref:Large ribosomal subunit protein uL6 n=1 Tax=Candidatus Sungbacteria bacterium RIFCSPLOWO2_01_FULL_60_25 TaxID=1802281 RepID=A0A1G2LD35_9BACT|nr:MAG: 50S ribosomal protein L6 [Candidatus Sungbacteria bacterium RIFCSPLOWO2_01_FULL_60_25]
MSRIGKQPIVIPDGVTVHVEGKTVTVAGPNGTLTRTVRPEVAVAVEHGALRVTPASASRKTPAYWGLTRALLAAMVEGVGNGFSRKLEIEGIGYRATMDGQHLQLAVGFSHPVRIAAPSGITFAVEKNAITISGADKGLVGDVAAEIRRIRPPEPYKGKGIRYAGEVIRRKAGKKAATAGA